MSATSADRRGAPTEGRPDLDDANLAVAAASLIHSEGKRTPNSTRASGHQDSASGVTEASRNHPLGSEDSASTHSNDELHEILDDVEKTNKPLLWSHDWTQSVLAGMIVLTVPLTVVLAWVTVIHGVPAPEVKDISLVLFGPLAGLAGAVVGYYYGKEAKPASPRRSK